MEEQVPKRAGGDRDHGKPKPGAAGERASRTRGRTLPGQEPEKRGQMGSPGSVGVRVGLEAGRLWRGHRALYTGYAVCAVPPLPRGRPDVFHFKRMLTIHRDIRGSEEMYPGY